MNGQKYEVVCDLCILEISKNCTKRARLMRWGDDDVKLDVRAWYTQIDGQEVPGKGVCFSTTAAEALAAACGKVIEANCTG